MYKLYWAPATAALAPQAVLEEAGVAYEIERIDLDRQEQRRPDYLALNPGGYVPTLVTGDGQVLTESAAITLSLCERHPETGLLPAPGDPERELCLRWIFYMTNNIQAARAIRSVPESRCRDVMGLPPRAQGSSGRAALSPGTARCVPRP